jgi:hypothetical protein
MSNLDDLLRKVQALIAQADHPNTGPAEADSFRAKAEALMLKYRIDETMLSSTERKAQALNVQWRTIFVCDATSEFRQSYSAMIRSLIAHMECRADYIATVNRNGGDLEYMSQRRSDSGYEYVINIVGYESDLRFIEAMFTAASLAFSSRLEPKYDPKLSEQVNAYLMRSAGMEGRRIAMAIYGRDDKALRPKVRKMFEAESLKRGEDPKVLLGRGSNMALFRESFALGFTNEFSDRLWRMRSQSGLVGHELVLASRKEAIDEAFYERFPDRRPKPYKAIGEANISTCAKCSKAASGYCREHQWMKPRASRGRVRYANGTAMARGKSAAQSIDMGITNRQIN